MNEQRYLVLDDPKNDGDSFSEVYETLEEANAAAERAWSYKTANERSHRRIHVALVRREWLEDYAVDEDTGAISWECFSQYDTPDGAFDSDKAVV